MKKVLLVNTNTERAPYPVPPLGISLLAAVLEGEYEVRVFDGVFSPASELPGVVARWKPDYIGFSIRNIDDILIDRVIFYVESIIREFIEPVREITRVPLILGGSGFSIFPAEVLEMSRADFGIAGEGEEALPMLLKKLDNAESPAGIPNLYTKDHGSQKPSITQAPADLSAIPFAEIDRRIDFSPYRTKGVYSVQTKRGCAHGCIYCTYPIIEGHTFRIRDPEEIADELVQVGERLGPVTVEFVDSTFNDPAGHAEAVCRAIIRRKPGLRFRTMGINPRNVSPELFPLMKEAGFTQIDATPDTASPAVLKRMKKGFALRDIVRTARLIRESEMPTMWFFLFGGPGETEDTIRETFDFIDGHVHPEDMVFLSGGLRIYPGTPLSRIALREGVIARGESLLWPPAYYFSPGTPRAFLDAILKDALKTRLNCVLGADSAPPQEMLAKAVAWRERTGTMEPMFRTLLRVRKEGVFI